MDERTRGWGAESGAPQEFGGNGQFDADHDPWVAAQLRVLDPASADPLYWERFSRQVVVRARPELERRRMLADLSVAGILSSWARGLVPLTLAAAAVAGFLLVRTPEGGDRMAIRHVGVDELLVDGLVADPIPAFEVLESDFEMAVAFATEIR